MAYRFLLEVPEALAADADVAVSQVPDAQVLLVRDSHGLGFDDPYVDLSIASHSLQVIQSLYDWFDTLGASRPDIRIVLHSGDRVQLEAADRGEMVRAIRRDQPWVERSIPKVGEHEPVDEAGSFTLGAGLNPVDDPIDGTGISAPQALRATGAALLEPEPKVRIQAVDHVAVRVNNLAKAERFYQDFLGMELIGRLRRNDQGAYDAVDRDYQWDIAIATGKEAEVCFLRNGALTLALHNIGRGVRLGRNALDHIAVRVDAATFTNLRGEALVRPMTILRNDDQHFEFRDPFGIAWVLSVDSDVPGLPL